MVSRLDVVSQETKHRGVPVGQQEVDVTIEVPVGQRQSATIFEIIQAGNGRNIGKRQLAQIEKSAIPFLSTEGTANPHLVVKQLVLFPHPVNV